MSKFALFSEVGVPTAFYSEDVHGARVRPVYGDRPEPTLEDPSPVPPVIGEEPNPHCNIPAGTTELTDAQWRELIENPEQRCWDGSAVVLYTPPPLPVVVPFSVTMRQAKLMLLRTGMLARADAIIAAMEGVEGDEARIEWSFSTVLERDHPLVLALGAALDLPAEQIDSLFIWASAL